MKRLLAVLLLWLAASGCYTVPKDGSDRLRPVTASPCEDSLFVALHARPLDSLSEREYEYFMEKERQCAGWKETTEIEETKKTAVSSYTALSLVALIAGIIVAAGASQ